MGVDLPLPIGVQRAVHRVAKPFIALFACHTDSRQKRPQLEPGFVNLRFRCAFADAEDRGDFVVLKPFHVVEHERRASAFGQPRNSPLEIQPLGSDIRHDLGSGHRLLVERRRGPARPGLAMLQVIETPIHRQPIQPGSYRGVTAKFRELSIGQQKDFL